MSIESYYTTHAAPPATQSAGAGKGLSAPASLQGLDFINMILGRMLEQSQDGETLSEQQPQTTDSSNPLLSKKPKLDLAALLAVNPEVEEYVKNHITCESSGLCIEDQITQTLALNQVALDGTFAPLTDNIITVENVEKGSPRLLQALLLDTEKDKAGLLKNLSLILDKLKRLTDEGGGVGLALTNMTPEQITSLKSKIESLLAKQDISTAENAEALLQQQKDEDTEIADIVLGLIRILPPQAQPEVIVLPQGLVITPRPLQIAGASPASSKPANDLASRLNDLVVGGGVTPSAEGAGSKGDTGFKSFTPGENENLEDLDNLLKEFSGKKGNGAGLELGATVGKNKPASTPGLSANLSALLNWPFTQSGSLNTSSFSSLDETLAATFPLNNPATYTNASTQAARAGSSLPAVQMIAISMQKAVSDGQNKNLILQLDPPELGRVEVRLSFGKDKAVKAVVATERPETLSMLQRDSHVLERALGNVGLDAGGGLSFEMAGDGYFDQNGGHDGSGGSHGNSGNGATENELIESTMTWYVDAATGHVRYDLLA